MTEPDATGDHEHLLEEQEEALLQVRRLNVIKGDPSIATARADVADTAAEKERLRREREAALAVGAGEELYEKRMQELKAKMPRDAWETLVVDIEIDKIEDELDRESGPVDPAAKAAAFLDHLKDVATEMRELGEEMAAEAAHYAEAGKVESHKQLLAMLERHRICQTGLDRHALLFMEKMLDAEADGSEEAFRQANEQIAACATFMRLAKDEMDQ